jgi:hypothetical protein
MALVANERYSRVSHPSASSLMRVRACRPPRDRVLGQTVGVQPVLAETYHFFQPVDHLITAVRMGVHDDGMEGVGPEVDHADPNRRGCSVGPVGGLRDEGAGGAFVGGGHYQFGLVKTN